MGKRADFLAAMDARVPPSSFHTGSHAFIQYITIAQYQGIAILQKFTRHIDHAIAMPCAHTHLSTLWCMVEAARGTRYNLYDEQIFQ
jgi:hypothetical protein